MTRTCPAAIKVQPRPWCNSRLFSVSAQKRAVLLAGDVSLQDLQHLQRQLDEKTTECEELESSLDSAMAETLYATNDAELWQGAYHQTVSADLERQNGELLGENFELKQEVKRASESPSVFLECHSMSSIVEESCWSAPTFASATII